MIEIDGSFGEGGGQILRTALSLSSCLRIAFRIFNIRKSRKKPGLMPQHLTAVRALSAVCEAHVEGARSGSTEIVFTPAKINPDTYTFDIGTAGAVTLLLQALLPALTCSEHPSALSLTGGTHVPTSPCYNYIERVFIPLLQQLRIPSEVSIERYGFYPKGGGRIRARVSPRRSVGGATASIDLCGSPEPAAIRGISAVANLPLSIAERQRDAALRALEAANVPLSIDVARVEAFGPGTFIFLAPEGKSCLAGFSSLGKRGKRAEQVGEEAASALIDYLKSGMCLDPYLADQAALYLSMLPGTSSFTTSSITQHLVTNLAVIQQFIPVAYTVGGDLNTPGKITISGTGHTH